MTSDQYFSVVVTFFLFYCAALEAVFMSDCMCGYIYVCLYVGVYMCKRESCVMDVYKCGISNLIDINIPFLDELIIFMYVYVCMCAYICIYVYI